MKAVKMMPAAHATNGLRRDVEQSQMVLPPTRATNRRNTWTADSPVTNRMRRR